LFCFSFFFNITFQL